MVSNFAFRSNLRHYTLELWTKYGLRGKITDAVGTHGHMKCLLNGVVQAGPGPEPEPEPDKHFPTHHRMPFSTLEARVYNAVV